MESDSSWDILNENSSTDESESDAELNQNTSSPIPEPEPILPPSVDFEQWLPRPVPLDQSPTLSPQSSSIQTSASAHMQNTQIYVRDDKHCFRENHGQSNENDTEEDQETLPMCDLSHLAPIQSKASTSRSISRDNGSLGDGGGLLSQSGMTLQDRWCSMSVAFVHFGLVSIAAIFSFLRPDIPVRDLSMA